MLGLPPASAGFLIGVFFDPENGGNTFFRNFGLFQNYTDLEKMKNQMTSSGIEPVTFRLVA
jgi:hypothetical protein